MKQRWRKTRAEAKDKDTARRKKARAAKAPAPERRERRQSIPQTEETPERQAPTAEERHRAAFEAAREAARNATGDPGALPRLKTLDRVLSKFGICSRTESRQWILRGRLKVNGKQARDPEQWVDLDNDEVFLDNKPVRAEAKRYVLLYKPVGYLTTYTDPDGRATVYALIGDVEQWVFPVGRLDLETSGLLLMTNDSELAEYVTNPESHVAKSYLVKADKVLDEEQLEMLRNGVELKDGPTRPAQVHRVRDSERYTILEITISEGRNRQVRRMIEALGAQVLKLVRIAIGPLRLGTLPVGGWRELTQSEVEHLRRAGRKQVREEEEQAEELGATPVWTDDAAVERLLDDASTDDVVDASILKANYERERGDDDPVLRELRGEDEIDAAEPEASVEAETEEETVSEKHDEWPPAFVPQDKPKGKPRVQREAAAPRAERRDDAPPKFEKERRPKRVQKYAKPFAAPRRNDEAPREERGESRGRDEREQRPPRKEWGDRQPAWRAAQPPRGAGYPTANTRDDERPRRRYDNDRNERGGGYDSRPPRREFSSDGPRGYGRRDDAPRGGYTRRDDGDARPPRREFSNDGPRGGYGRRDDGDTRPPRREFGNDARAQGPRGGYGRRDEGDARPPRRSFGNDDRAQGPRGFGRRDDAGERPPRRNFRDNDRDQRPRGYGRRDEGGPRRFGNDREDRPPLPHDNRDGRAGGVWRSEENRPPRREFNDEAPRGYGRRDEGGDRPPRRNFGDDTRPRGYGRRDEGDARPPRREFNDDARPRGYGRRDDTSEHPQRRGYGSDAPRYEQREQRPTGPRKIAPPPLRNPKTGGAPTDERPKRQGFASPSKQAKNAPPKGGAKRVWFPKPQSDE